MFLTGDGMSDGPLHRHISGAPLIGERRTAPRYRFYSVRDEFPVLCPVAEGGGAILGELYDVPMSQLRDLLAREPPELELSIVELAAGAAPPGEPQDPELSFGMVLRRGERDRGGHRHHALRGLAGLPPDALTPGQPASKVARARGGSSAHHGRWHRCTSVLDAGDQQPRAGIMAGAGGGRRFAWAVSGPGAPIRPQATGQPRR